MKTIAVMNLKGGIGKTITSTSLAYILGDYGISVLIIDGDAQGNTSKIYGRYDPDGSGISALLENPPQDKNELFLKDIIKTTKYPNIDIIPANSYLMRTNAILMTDPEKNQINILKTAIENTGISDDYDVCICDCGLMLDMAALNILMLTDLVIAPVKVGGFEADALATFSEQLNDLKQLNPRLDMRVLMTMRQKNKASSDMEEWIRCSSPYWIFNTTIRRSVVVEKSTTAFVPLPDFSKKNAATRDYWDFVDYELLKYLVV